MDFLVIETFIAVIEFLVILLVEMLLSKAIRVRVARSEEICEV